MDFKSILEKIYRGDSPEKNDLTTLLSAKTGEETESLFSKAYEIKKRHIGQKAHFRGLIEIGNICEKDCRYCGIRKSNKRVERFFMDEEEIVSEALFAYRNQYGSVVLQSGERQDDYFTEFIERAVRRIKEISSGELGVTLCLGEQSEETYRRWFAAGAHRYLLRIETSNPEIYRNLHPPDHDFEARKSCLHLLKKLGYQLGTGVMIGLPGQSLEDLADDIFFFRDCDCDMIGMGPFIPHKDTPMCADAPLSPESSLELALKMIAVTRLVLRDVNIASTTALQALSPTGREMGLLAGANIIMPNLTDTKYRASYQLYDGKPCLDENSSMCKNCLQRRIESIGESIGFGEWGDSPHFKKGKQ